MKEIICPNCGKAIKVDEADYAAILEQIKNAEFEKSVERRVEELREAQVAQQKAEQAQNDLRFQGELSKKEQAIAEKDNEITRLKAQIDSSADMKRLEIASAVSEKEKESADAIAALKSEIANLKSAIEQGDSRLKLALMEEAQKSQAAILSKEAEISQLKSQAALERKEAELREKNLNEKHANEIQQKDAEVAMYREFKIRKSTKAIGEDLEQYCYKLYNQNLRPVMSEATFEKDNDASEGSKGDFIFRDRVDGTEYVSIMFEMKNEADDTEKKHKNADFFDKLDKDRKKKNCEFAVLVSMLEMDQDLYNDGIVSVAGYDKMYVVRPENFIPIITLLVQTSKKVLEYQKELAIARTQSIDVANFEDKLNEFKDKFDNHAKFAKDRFEDAIKAIDESIKKLQAVRENLRKSSDYVRLAGGDVEDLTIKKLTWGNPTMKEKFKAAKEAKELESSPEEQ